jgi:hypothetical protein
MSPAFGTMSPTMWYQKLVVLLLIASRALHRASAYTNERNGGSLLFVRLSRHCTVEAEV